MTRHWLRRPLALRVVFGATMATLSVLLVWLGVETIQRDRQDRVRHADERLEATAERVSAALDKRLSGIEQELDRMLIGGAPVLGDADRPDMMAVQLSASGARAWPEGRLLYTPKIAGQPPFTVPIFDDADGLESAGNFEGAVAALQPSTTSPNLRLRAAGLTRVARDEKNAGRSDAALKTYAQLATLGATVVDGADLPAGLAAHLGVLHVLQAQGRTEAADDEARALRRALAEARWPVSVDGYRQMSEEVQRALPGEPVAPDPRLELADVVDRFWSGDLPTTARPEGRAVVALSSGPVLLLWRRHDATAAIFAATPAFVERAWLPALDAPVALTNAQGQPFARVGADAGHHVVRAASALPWALEISGPPAQPGLTRVLIVASLGTLLLVVLAGGWFIGRAVTREIEAAQLQSDFVSAVSHEFRTPLTTLCQLSELLTRGRVATDADRQDYYRLIHSESDRLRRLVEGLLQFGRVDAGRLAFHFEPTDVNGLVRACVQRFTDADLARAHRLTLDLAPAAPVVVADRDALDCVVWNLIENAVKYSPDGGEVRISVSTERGRTVIAVRDEGIGIPRVEQRRMFERFARGAGAMARHIRGTGLGLATAHGIVRAHGGDIDVESDVGKGSTFWVRLPVERAVTAESRAGAATLAS